jgi:Ca2+-binding RTX toxin-like protein
MQLAVQPFMLVNRNSARQIEITADNEHNNILVQGTADGRYEVNVNGQSQVFAREQMSGLVVRGGKGNDAITIAHNVDIPVHVDARGGNNTIVNHAHGAQIRSGGGNDAIANYGNDVRISAGKGNDVISNSGNRAAIDGGRGNDSINNVSNDSFVSGGRGDDAIWNSGRGNIVDAGSGNDGISSVGDRNILRGRRGRDSIANWGSNNVIAGGRGNDALNVFGHENRAYEGGLPRSRAWERLGLLSADDLTSLAGFFGVDRRR